MCVGGGGGGGRGGGRGGEFEEEDMNTNATIFFYTRHTGMTSSTEPYSLMKIFLTVYKIGGIVPLTL